MDWIRAHAIALGLDPDAMAIAAQARIDQAQAWQRTGGTIPPFNVSDLVLISPAACPDDCSCHAYMPPGRVCSWCQQEGHEDSPV